MRGLGIHGSRSCVKGRFFVCEITRERVDWGYMDRVCGRLFVVKLREMARTVDTRIEILCVWSSFRFEITRERVDWGYTDRGSVSVVVNSM